MITTAVILAAGLGSRLKEHTVEMPKGFLEINGESLVAASVRKLIDAGIQKIILGTGYLSEVYDTFASQYPGRITCVKNERFAESGSMSTLYSLREEIGSDDFLVLESDLLYDSSGLVSLLNSEESNVILSSGPTHSNDEVFIEADDNKHLINMSKRHEDLHSIYSELVGISKLSNQFYQKMCEVFEASDTLKIEYEAAIVKASSSLPIHVLKIDDFAWCEIDDESHLNRAILLISKRVADAEVSSSKKQIVYVSFTTDVIHAGHLNIIQKAAKFGEVIAGIQTDDIIMKTMRYPLLPLEERMKLFENVKGISRVVVQDELFYDKILRELKPDYVVHGDDWVSNYQRPVRDRVIEVLNEWGGQLVEYPYTKSPEITNLEGVFYDKIGVPEVRRGRLKKLLESGQTLRVMEAHSGLSALIVENTRVVVGDETRHYDAMWVSSLCDSTMKGKPDIELVDMTSRIKTIEEIMDVTTKPIILDADSGGLLEHFEYNVKTLERIGVSAVIIEDKVGLKKNSLFGTEANQKQDSIENFCAKIRAGKKATTTTQFLIFARCESLILEQGMEDAIKRCSAYVDAGADGIMIHSKSKQPDEVFEFCDKFKILYPMIPIVAVPTTYNTATEEELASHGVSVIIHANHLLRSAFPAMQKTAESVLLHGRSKEADEMCMSINEILNLIPSV